MAGLETFPPLAFPAPRLGGARAPPPTPTGPPPINVLVAFPPDPGPIGLAVMPNRSIRSTVPIDSDVFPWPRSGTLSIRLENNHDAAVRYEVHGSRLPNSGNPNPEPIVVFEVGPRETKEESLDPGAGDAWSPYVWVRAIAPTIPSSGETMVTLTRVGERS